MTPNYRAFTNELFLIKMAAQEEKKPRNWEPFKHAIKHIAAYAAGFGIGDAATKMMCNRFMPKTFANMPPDLKKHMPMIIGALSGVGAILTAEALRPLSPSFKPNKETNPDKLKHH